MTYQRISQSDYDKALGQFRLQLNGIMCCFHCYGLTQDADAATEEIIKLAELFTMKVRGKDIPLVVRNEPRPRPTE